MGRNPLLIVLYFSFMGLLLGQESSKLCPLCGSGGDLNCDNVHQCTKDCGHVKSINYPSNYGNNHRCRWSIRAPDGYYVRLTIFDFDIPSANNASKLGTCIFDYLTLIDGYTGKRIGCYCNEHLPPPYIVSPWNELIIQFDTNSETTGRGFHFKYEFKKLELDEHIKRQLKPPDLEQSATSGVNESTISIKSSNLTSSSSSSTSLLCQPGWQYFRYSCYKAFSEPEPLQWYDAENKCNSHGKGLDGHLVSILDKDEMLVIHYFLTNVWKSARYVVYYIGLIDVTREGVYRWSDNNPMSYTNWELHPMLLEEEMPAQPDGGAYEDCTIIRYNSYSRNSNWHDVPCSLGKHYHSYLEKSPQMSYKWDYVNSYICKSDSISMGSSLRSKMRHPTETIFEPEKDRFQLNNLDHDKYFVCDNLEVISVVLRCDGVAHCRDGSDESHGCNQDCLDWQLQCKNGRCISVGSYCNFIDDCGDGTDESRCERHRCKLNEFRCQSGQCIPQQQRCDLIPDCSDSSDEGRLCTIGSNCNSASTFQCYNGNCIPQYAVCDFQIDCPGKFHEDEDIANCDLLLKNRSLTDYKLLTTSSPATTNYSNNNNNNNFITLNSFNNNSQQSLAYYQLNQETSIDWSKQNLSRCNSGNMINSSLRCLYEFDRYGYQIGCRDVTHLNDCADFQCKPHDYVKCSNSYCIPWRYICDGKWDCIMGEDEIGCARYVCPGQYKCANQSSCILLHQLCDGQPQCPMGDDEWFCDMQCPSNCHCIGQYVDCRNANLTSLITNYISRSVRKLDLSYNKLGPNLSSSDFNAYHDLGELILHHNGIEVLIPRKFNQLRNLYKLDLSYNQIHSVKRGAFANLRRVTQLLLESNPELVNIEPEAFLGLSSLQMLNISSSRILALRKNTFDGLTSLRYLLLRSNMIVEIEDGAFRSLTSLVSLDMRGNEIRHFTKSVFSDLKSLRNLSTDSFKFCCLVNQQIPSDRCLPLPDEISDCEDLLSSVLQRGCLWIAGGAAVVGNSIVIFFRYRDRLGEKGRISQQVDSSLLLSLGCSDFLMGIYLLLIASVDMFYRGHYIENADNWRESPLCNLCGFLSTVSSEVSVFTLVSMALNRLTEICYPLHSPKYKFTLAFTRKLILVSWCIALTIASLPLMITPYFRGQFYARSGVCLAFHITNQKAAGWLYSIGVFLCVNLVAFIIIVTCYTKMYLEISRQNRREKPNHPKQIALIVMTSFVAWSPTIILGFIALAGIALPAAVYSWIAVLVLPVNSAINPLIYTVPTICRQANMLINTYRARKSGGRNQALVNMNSSQLSNGQAKGLLPMLSAHAKRRQDLAQRNIPAGYVSLEQFVCKSPQFSDEHLVAVALEIARDIEEKHRAGKVYIKLSTDEVFVSDRIIIDGMNNNNNNNSSSSNISSSSNNNIMEMDNSANKQTDNRNNLNGDRQITLRIPSGNNLDLMSNNSAQSQQEQETNFITYNALNAPASCLKVFLFDHAGYKEKQKCHPSHREPRENCKCRDKSRHYCRPRNQKTLSGCECSDLNRLANIIFELLQFRNKRKLVQNVDETTTKQTIAES